MSDEKPLPFYYEPQERAMAPGISGDWPEVIVPKGMKNARLVKRTPSPAREDLAKAVAAIAEDLLCGADIACDHRGISGLEGAVRLKKLLASCPPSKSEAEIRAEKICAKCQGVAE